MPIIQLLIISDVHLYREGLKQILNDDERIQVIEMAQDVEEAIIQTQELSPDIVLFDMAAADAITNLRKLTQQSANTKVVALAVSEEYQEVIGCAEAGVSGYIFRNDSVDDLIATLERVVQDELPCSHRISAMLLRRVSELALTEKINFHDIRLTRRELEILRLISEGLSNKAISNRLLIEISTVKNHIHNLLEKLRVHTRGEAIVKLKAILTSNRMLDN